MVLGGVVTLLVFDACNLPRLWSFAFPDKAASATPGAIPETRERILRRMAERPDPCRLEKLSPETDGPDAAPEQGLRGRSRWTSTSVASLELAKQGQVGVKQEDSFAPILVHAGHADRSCSEDI